MSERDDQALYRAVLERPNDDAPRLLYADAVRDAGADRFADFIEWQLKHPKVAVFRKGADCGGDLDMPEVQRHEFCEHHAHWFRQHSRDAIAHVGWGWAMFNLWRVIWRRGFPDEVGGLTADEAYESLQGWRARFPLRRAVVRGRLGDEYASTLQHRYGRLKRVGDLELLRWFTGVAIVPDPDQPRWAGYPMPSGFRTTVLQMPQSYIAIWETVPADAEDD